MIRISPLFEFRLQRVKELAPEEDVVNTLFINRANAGRRDLFPGIRLGPGDLREDYDEGWILSLRQKGELVGTATLREQDGSLWIYLLAVAPEERGKGLGVSLIARAGKFAAEYGINELVLDAVDRGRLVAYYRSLGFEETGRRTFPKGHWGATGPFDLVRMRSVVGSSRSLVSATVPVALPPGSSLEMEDAVSKNE